MLFVRLELTRMAIANGRKFDLVLIFLQHSILLVKILNHVLLFHYGGKYCISASNYIIEKFIFIKH